MRKLHGSLLMLFVLIGLMLPASAQPVEKKSMSPNIDVDINNAVVTQTQVAVPISIGNKNTALFGGDAGTQSIYQIQYSGIHQSNK